MVTKIEANRKKSARNVMKVKILTLILRLCWIRGSFTLNKMIIIAKNMIIPE